MEPIDRLRLMVAADRDPALSDEELEQLVALAAAPTGSLEAAAAEGWRWKAGKVADRVDLADEAAQLKRSQLHTQCLAMARQYDNQAAGLEQKADTAARPLARFTC